MSVYVDPAHLTYRGWEEVHEILLKAVEPKADMTVSQWADKRRVLSAKHAKQSGDWDTGKVPFMREIMDGLSARSPVRSIFLMKGAQVAGTECGNNWVGYTIVLDPSPVIVSALICLLKSWT